MSNTLYRKYRPQKFSDVIGQEHVKKTLQNAIQIDRIGHAYLFTGPRGTGKTTLARIFSKAINCEKTKNSEPCGTCPSCKIISTSTALDIIEIDAASNTGVDNIRELRETINLPPTSLKYKVYIIDEVHMLSIGAFNALLKTLEEPPSHVVFIMATTESHKIPETILSRSQRFDFSRLALSQMIERLAQIAKLEKVKIDRDALEIIASTSEGGMRDAESLMGQVISMEDKYVTKREVEFLLGSVGSQEIQEFTGLLLSGESAESVAFLEKIKENGVDFRNFHKILMNFLRYLMIISLSPQTEIILLQEMTKERLEKLKALTKNSNAAKILKIIKVFQENNDRFRNSALPHLYLIASIAEISLGDYQATDWGNPSGTIKIESIPTSAKKMTEAPPEPKKTDAAKAEKTPPPVAEKKLSKNIDADALGLDDVLRQWSSVIEGMKPHNHSLSSVLKMSQPALKLGNDLILKAKYEFYKDKINDRTNRLTIEKVIDSIMNCPLQIKALTEKEFGELYPEAAQKKSVLQEAVDIFGGKIVSE